MQVPRPMRLLVALALVLSVLAGLASAAYAAPRPDAYVLPGNTVFPEGITFDESTGYFYVSSTMDGTIFRGHVKDSTASVFLPGNTDGRTFAAGLEVDKEGRLFVAGGGTGNMFVYDTETEELLASFNNGNSPTFVNDVTVTKNGDAFFTDSQSPFLYRVFTNASGDLAFEEWLDFTGTVLEWETGFNVNGIVSTPDGKYLIVVQSNTGELFRISLATREVVQIDLGGATVTAGDGLVLKGHRLYVVRNSFRLISEVALAGDYTSGSIVDETTDPSFIFPTTAVEARGRLLVVNSQFNNRGPGLSPVLPFTVSSVKLP
ncbi:MAG: SMP-30/gluconolactonase/LRE family protein [Chloroflexota bacterium]